MISTNILSDLVDMLQGTDRPPLRYRSLFSHRVQVMRLYSILQTTSNALNAVFTNNIPIMILLSIRIRISILLINKSQDKLRTRPRWCHSKLSLLLLLLSESLGSSNHFQIRFLQRRNTSSRSTRPSPLSLGHSHLVYQLTTFQRPSLGHPLPY